MTDQRELVGKINLELIDIRSEGFDELLDKNDYSASQAFALNAKNSGHNGIIYPSVRHQACEYRCCVLRY